MLPTPIFKTGINGIACGVGHQRRYVSDACVPRHCRCRRATLQ
eukprot:COSAG01_NODE_19017_length_1036_cov_1.632871_1_plen_42_part_01